MSVTTNNYSQQFKDALATLKIRVNATAVF